MDRHFRIAERMPRLPHSVPGREFDIMASEACTWLAAQPEIRQAVFNVCKGAGLICYDAESGTWCGRRWGGGDSGSARDRGDVSVDTD